MAMAKETLDAEVIEAVSDKGYESREDILNCVMNGIVPNVALKYDKEERVFPIGYVENEITERERYSTKPEDVQKCIHAGVLPACYEGTAISVELQGQGEISCFALNEDGTVICPAGNIMAKLRTRGQNTIFGNHDACRQCPNRCTGSGKGKAVSFGPGVTAVPVRMYGKSNRKLNHLPEGTALYNSFWRKDHARRQVILRIRPDLKKLMQRMCLSEHPFGTVKWYGGAHYLLCKGKEKVTGELGLSFLAYNLRRAINLVGIEALVAAM
jgi:hypothetical protein